MKPKQPKSGKQVTFRLPPERHRALKMWTAEHGVSAQALIERGLSPAGATPSSTAAISKSFITAKSPEQPEHSC